MSTLSEQADKLRKVAMETRMSEPVLDEVYMLPNTKVANAMQRAANEMDAAADTILKLSDDLQLVNTENARLIKKVNELDTQINLYVQTTLRAFGLVKENNEVLGSLAEDSIKLQKQGERLFDETLELSAENAKLQEELEAAKHDLSLFSSELVASKFENAKLRELVRDIYSEYRYLRVRFHRTYVQHEERMRAIEQRMRDLGIEADE